MYEINIAISEGFSPYSGKRVYRHFAKVELGERYYEDDELKYIFNEVFKAKFPAPEYQLVLQKKEVHTETLLR